ncbi:MAG: hypothetical protein AAF961_04275, partial [Planctomycetota bacterium]
MSLVESGQYCAFCGLPVSASPARDDDSQRTIAPDFCCSGCRFSASVADAESIVGPARQLTLRLGLAVFFTMNVMVFTMALWSRDLYASPSFDTEFAKLLRGVFRWASLLFSAPVLIILGEPIAAGVAQAIRRRAITTDMLILLGVGASYLYSLISVLRGEGHVYFEVGCMVLVFVSIGRLLEARGKRQTSDALDALGNLLPETVRRVTPQGVDEIGREQAAVGDVIRVLPGERIPVDGRIVVGAGANLDEQMVT